MVLACACATLLVSAVGRATTNDAVFPLDPTWAASQPVPGLIRLQLDGLPDYGSRVRVLPDGSAIVALGGISPVGYGDGRAGIAKLRANGMLDTTFNPTGAVPGIADQLASGQIVDMEVDHSGRIVIAGIGTVMRLRADGTPDSNFVATCIHPCIPGQGEPPPLAPIGVVYVQSRVYDLAVLGDDSIIVESSNEINQSPYVMRATKLTATGDRDLTFNPGDPRSGELTIDDYGPAKILPQSDGTYILIASSSPPRLHRITANGLLDTSYGTAGTTYPPVANTDETIWQSTTSGPDLVILLARSFPSGPSSLARIHVDGSTDTTFGNGGRIDLTSLGVTLNLGGLFVLADGRILVEVSTQTTSALARLTEDGRLDASFNPHSNTPGWLVIDPGPDQDHGHAISDLTETTNGTLLAVGSRFLHGSGTDPIAEIYRFSAFPGAPQPIDRYPISSPPPAQPPPITTLRSPTINTPANANARAVRLTSP